MRARCGRVFRARVRGHDRARQSIECLRGKFERARKFRSGAEDAFDGQRHADDSRRAHDDLISRQPSSSATRSRGGPRRDHPVRPDRAVRVSGIDDDRAHRVRGFLDVLPGKNHRRRLHQILREHGRGRSRHIRNDQRDVERARVAALLQAAGRRRKTKPARQGAGGWKFAHFPITMQNFKICCSSGLVLRPGGFSPAKDSLRARNKPASDPSIRSGTRRGELQVQATPPKAPFPLRSKRATHRARDTRPRPWPPGRSGFPWGNVTQSRSIFSGTICRGPDANP